MIKRFFVPVLVAGLIATVGATAHAADTYAVDTMHAGVNFKISHLGLSWISGRFNEYSGEFTIDESDPSKCSFALNIKVESVDTANQKRDDHLRSPDFFNVKQYPAITFQSTSCKPIKNGYEVTGDFTFHGVTKPITFSLIGGRKAEFPKGTHRTGYSTDLVIKRSDFGMDKFGEALGDEVHTSISFEGVKK